MLHNIDVISPVDLQEEDILYRGCFQGQLEMRVLENMVASGKPSYQGFKSYCTGRKITFLTTHYPVSLIYMESSFFKMVNLNKRYYTPFSKFPMLIELGIKKYKDRVYCPAQGDGLVILDEIDLEDINILYSSRIDITEEKNPKYELVTKNFKTRIRTYKERNYPEEDLLTRFEEDKRKTIVQLCFAAYGPKPAYTKEDTDLILRYLEVLKKLLGGNLYK